MLVFNIMLGPNAGRTTTDVEQYLRWMKSTLNLSDEHVQKMRDIVRESADIDRVTDEAAARFAPDEETL